ncbi:MAG: penicillin-binding transpeptidase domain-containing protein [Terriglobia bacterium]
MLKRLAILALATVWLLGTDLAAAPGVGPKSGDDPSTTSPKSSTKSPVRKTTTARRTRRSRRARSPWRISSFGDPTADDNPAGDDPSVRQAAVEALGNWNGSIVVVDPNSGRILSMVNQKLALASGFTPCSTFKPVVALAALKEGIITPTTKLYVGGRTRQDLTDALARSNNVFFHKLGEMLGFRRLSEYAHEFGLGQKAGLNIPGESAGRYPSAPPKEGGVGYLAYYGQDIEVTPLQMAAIISTIANGGTLYALQYPRTLEEPAAFHPVVRRRLDALAEYIPQIRDGLAAAVLYGTARSAYDPDLSIFGKTGTCSENGARLGWFVSYAGGLQPQYVVVVLLRGGPLVYGPHAAEIAGRLYRELIPKEQPTQASAVPTF